ncbi:peptidase, S41 family [Algoriphagus machipongonensis]|uniref:Peptidase, S41 family n=1 Tax=Algoriphagus machipongonensis TaxID=388413 RepID=A3HT25_9BACT|nr:peptidase, S41 family [Algoriphagus machipongonensis]
MEMFFHLLKFILSKRKTLKKYLLLLCTILSISCYGQKETHFISINQVREDLNYLDEILREKSSYQGLNGFDYHKSFDTYLNKIESKDSISVLEFGLFLSQTMGKIGDRHSYIKGYDLPESKYLPMAFAPLDEKVLVLEFDREQEVYKRWHSEYPYLKSIEQIPINDILSKSIPGEELAPENSFTLRAVRELRNIETLFYILNKELPNPISITLTNEEGEEKLFSIPLVEKDKRPRIWDERYHKKGFFFEFYEDQINNRKIIEQFFRIDDQLAYIQIPSMVDRKDSPTFFQMLGSFMEEAKNTEALIIDVRDNGGGSRDLIQELAGYLVHPDSIYVVNVTRQRGELPLNNELKERLNSRFLFPKSEFEPREQETINRFISTFEPMYQLNEKNFSENYYYLLNGKKLSTDKYHFNKPVYILANERTFSAASILVSVFKGLPNIKIVGTNTDGSSGNSERFNLPHSQLDGKISTMVSFQKDGQILDGIGTSPDIRIERNLNQVYWSEDYQLQKLIELIEEEIKNASSKSN